MSRGLVFATAAAVFAWLAGAAPDAAAQKVYKWTDSDGKVHFSNVSPGGEAATSEEVPEAAAPGEEAAAATSSGEPEAPPRAAPPAGSEASAGRPEVSDAEFSSRVSGTRLRLKRELAQAKERAQAAEEKLAALKKERDQPARMGLEILQKAYGPDRHASTEEDDLRKDKAAADKRAEEIRKQYGELRDEAVKRYGGQPSWWLPIE